MTELRAEYRNQARLVLRILPLLLKHPQFAGMVRIPASLLELEEARTQIIRLLHDQLTTEGRQFILSIKEGNPRWDLLPINNIDKLPAVQWKLHNIKQMSTEKHSAALID